MPRTAPDDKKFVELLLLIAHLSQDDPGFGYTKLNKLAFYADFLAFGRLRSAITWQPYRKLKWGPAAVRMKRIQAVIEEEGWGEIERRRVFSHIQQRLVPLREADQAVFSDDEIRIVYDVVERLKRHGAASISELSHAFVGWRSARWDETIPYETVLLSSRPLSEAEKRYALNVEPTRGN